MLYRQYVRDRATTTVGEKCLDKNCPRYRLTGRACRGKLCDTILDWEASLPESDLHLAEFHSRYIFQSHINHNNYILYYFSSMADLNVCLGTTLQIVPSGKLPLMGKKYDGKLVVINLQATKHVKLKSCGLCENKYKLCVLFRIKKRISL